MRIPSLERFPEPSCPSWARVSLLSMSQSPTWEPKEEALVQSANKHLLTSTCS